MKNNVVHIPLSECKDGHLYFIEARNAALGVFRKADSAFIISRHKLGKNYLFPEFHHDYAGPCGTAYPFEDLGEVTTEDLLTLLNDHPKRVEYQEAATRSTFSRLGVTLPPNYFELNPL